MNLSNVCCQHPKRHLRRLLTVLACFCAGLALGAVQGNNLEVLEANGFHVLDSNGTVRAAIEMASGCPRLVLMNKEGKPTVTLTAEKDGPVFRFETDGKSVVNLVATEKFTRFQMNSPTGGPTFEAVVDQSVAKCLFRDVEGCTRFECGMNTTEGPFMVFRNKEGRDAVGMSVRNDEPQMIFFDSKGEETWRLPK